MIVSRRKWILLRRTGWLTTVFVVVVRIAVVNACLPHYRFPDFGTGPLARSEERDRPLAVVCLATTLVVLRPAEPLTVYGIIIANFLLFIRGEPGVRLPTNAGEEPKSKQLFKVSQVEVTR